MDKTKPISLCLADLVNEELLKVGLDKGAITAMQRSTQEHKKLARAGAIDADLPQDRREETGAVRLISSDRASDSIHR